MKKWVSNFITVMLLLAFFCAVAYIAYLFRREQMATNELRDEAGRLEVLVGELNTANAALTAENERLDKEAQQYLAESEALKKQVAVLQRQRVEAVQVVVTLPPTDQIKLFDSLTGKGASTVLIQGQEGTAKTPLFRVVAASEGLVERNYLEKENNAYGLIMASQDSVITRLESINVNQGVIIANKDKVIAGQDTLIDSCVERLGSLERQNRFTLIVGTILILITAIL